MTGITDDQIRDFWRNAGGSFHGPHVEHATMEEAKFLPFMRKLLRLVVAYADADCVEGHTRFCSIHGKDKCICGFTELSAAFDDIAEI